MHRDEIRAGGARAVATRRSGLGAVLSAVLLLAGACGAGSEGATAPADPAG